MPSSSNNAPELKNYYCCSCPIGEKTVEKIDSTNIDNIYKFAISTFNILEESNLIQKNIMKIFQNGKIDKSKDKEIEHIKDFFSNIEKRANELKIILERNKGVKNG